MLQIPSLEKIRNKHCYKVGKSIKSIEIKPPSKPAPPSTAQPDKPKLALAPSPTPAREPQKPKSAPAPALKPEKPKPSISDMQEENKAHLCCCSKNHLLSSKYMKKEARFLQNKNKIKGKEIATKASRAFFTK